MNKETTLQNKIRLAASDQAPNCRLFRNNVGQGWAGRIQSKTANRVVITDPFPLRAGLTQGSGDLIGWTSIRITPEMVGQKIAIFTSLEVKTPGGRVSRDQLNWLRTVNDAGGRAFVVRSVEEAIAVLQTIGL